MLKPLKLKLHPTPAQHTALQSTQEQFNAACNWIAVRAVALHCTNKIALQKQVYYAVRDQFGLSAQLTIRAIAKVVEAYKRDPTHPPTFRARGAIVYDERILSFGPAFATASILTLTGRIGLPVIVCAYHATLLATV